MPSGYQKILVPIDNSEHASWAMELGIGLARGFGSRLVGSHVYTAGLHDARFRQMEGDLPDRYQREGELQRQREVHDSLIARGLELISHSYLDACEQRCRQAAVAFERRVLEGKNYAELVRDIQAEGYDLAILGYQGLGALENNFIGSVCERVVRRVRTDLLIAKMPRPLGGKILVALDGSSQALAGWRVALRLAKAFGAQVEAVSVYDPHFHQVAFRSIAGVLSEEAGNLFRFREQERLHEEIIDKGLACIYQGHLEEASRIARQEGVEVVTTLLAGKPFHQILRHLEATRPSLLVVGRVGIHCTDGLDIGATTENLLRLAPCHIWIAAGEGYPPALEEGRLRWTEEAARELGRVPAGFMREAARARYEACARSRGQELVTPELIAEPRGRWSQGGEPVERGMAWTEEAEEKLGRTPAFIRPAIVRAVEELARKKGALEVTAEFIEEAKGQWKQGMPSDVDKA